MSEFSDNDMILYMAGCTLARKPGKNNWVEEDAVGGLPEYICRIARAINRDDPSKSISSVIAIAVGRVKTWARGGGGVTAKTRAQAAKAVAEWEKKKAAAKLDNKKMKASNDVTLYFSKSYNVDDVRKKYREQIATPGTYVYVREMWSDHMIVSEEDEKSIDGANKIYRVDYSVDKEGNPNFGNRVEMKMAYVPLSHADLQTSLTDAQLEKAALIPCTQKDNRSLVENVAKGRAMQEEHLKLLAFSADKPHLRNLIGG